MMLFVLACTGETDSTSKDISAFYEYYSGESTTTSPDGTRTYAENKVLVRRFVDPESARIQEETWYDTEARTTVMSREGETSVFSVQDDLKSFSGTITYSGPDWHYTGWTYAILMSDASGSLDGQGSLAAGVWDSLKTFYDPAQVPQAVISDQLHVIDEATFAAELPEHEPG